MLMHYIYDNQLLPEVIKYFDLVENHHLSIEGAMQQAFGMSARQFDKALNSYTSSGRYKFYAIPNSASISSNSYTVTPMSIADGNAIVADIHLHMRDYQDRALGEFQDILKSDRKNAAASRGLGYAYMQRKDFTQAAEYFSRATALDPKNPWVHYYEALLVVRQSGFGLATNTAGMIKELETSIELDPNFADAYALLSFAQSSSGETAKALVTMQKALAISPRNEGYLFNLANLYLANRQPGEAVEVLQSLQGTANPELARQVAAMLAQSRQFAEMTEGAKLGRMVTIEHSDRKEPDTDAPQKSISTPEHAEPAKFLRGTLSAADCSSPPLAVLTVISGTKSWKMKIADRNHFILIGADAFSCSWNSQKVAVNYRETADGEANVISLEIQ
jgi:tetratricopeptide (TPR) repeat protein